jgi:hypothetical protein
MNPLDLLILALATWRLAYLVTSEKGPFDIALRFRTRFPLGGLTSCLKCASLWCAAVLFVLGLTPLYPVVWVLAVSGAALMLASFSGVAHS